MLCIFPICFAFAEKLPVIIDTDASTDDAIALLYLLKTPTVDIKAIVVDTNGSSAANTAANHVAYLLKMLNKTQIPVYVGITKQPAFNNVYPPYAKKLIDDSFQVNNVKPAVQINKQQLIDIIQQQKKEVTVLSLGSLTNIANLLTTTPQLKKQIHSLIVMGGAVNVAGNIDAFIPKTENHYAEWNIYVDPESFQQVLTFNLPITLVALDVTNHVPVTEEFMQTLSQHLTTPSAQFVYTMLHENDQYIKNGEYDFWDPLAAYVLVHPAKTKTIKIDVKLTHDDHYAQIYETTAGYPIQLVTTVNQKAVEQAYIDVLTK